MKKKILARKQSLFSNKLVEIILTEGVMHIFPGGERNFLKNYYTQKLLKACFQHRDNDANNLDKFYTNEEDTVK